MKYYIIILTILIIIISILIANVRIVITRFINDQKINIDLYILPFFNYRIDFDELLKKKTKDKTVWEVLQNILSGLDQFSAKQKIVMDLCKYVVVKDVRIAFMYDHDYFLSIPYITVFNWIILTGIQSFIRKHFKAVKKEDFKVIIDNDTIDAKMLIDGKIKIYRLLWVIFKNFKPKERRKKYGTTSN